MGIEEIINEDFSINFKGLNSNPYLQKHIQKLRNVGYNSTWHQEGSVWNHTVDMLMHTNLFEKYLQKKEMAKENKKILMQIFILSCLFHDFGKAVTGRQKENGDWSFPLHAYKSEKITRVALWETNIPLRERICKIVSNHMFLNDIVKNDAKGYDMLNRLKMPKEDVVILCFLSMNDIMSSKISEDKKDDVNKNLNRLNYIIENIDKIYDEMDLGAEKNEKKEFTINMMCGISGSGKSTFIKKSLYSLPIVSRDIIREEMGMTNNGKKTIGTHDEENKITEIEEKRIIEFCKKKEAFVIDDMFLLKKYRKRIYEITKPYNPKIIIWYIESYSIENCIERRKGNINKDVILNMAEKLDFPAGEYADEIIYLKDVEK